MQGRPDLGGLFHAKSLAPELVTWTNSDLA